MASASAIAAASATTAFAGTATVNNLMFQDEEDKWINYTYIAKDQVRSLNESGAFLLAKGSDALGMSDGDPIMRVPYGVLGGLLYYRFSLANSVLLGHEYVHWQHAHRFGFKEHTFIDDDTGDEISRGEAYKRLFLNGEVGGPAASIGRWGDIDHSLYSEEGISIDLAGLNWQMSYSEDWIRHNAGPGSKNVFDGIDFFVNRGYAARYAYSDVIRLDEDNDRSGDVYKFAAHLEGADDADETLRKLATYGLAANLLSPTYWASIAGVTNYFFTGETAAPDYFFDTSIGGATWDIPQFMNVGSYTLAPTVYIDTSRDIAGSVGAERLLLSASVETAVMGEADDELRLSATGRWGAFETDLAISAGGEGQFYEIEAAYNVNDHFAITAGAAVVDGDTLRGNRNMPTGDNAFWLGTRLTF